ncbi:alpha/beta fold hydrolase [Xylophilus sp. GW821-FHT01B05]
MPALHFEKQGTGPVLVLSHALGCDLHMWDGVAAALAARFTVLRYDHRNHGRSPLVPGAFSIEDLADDAAALIRAEAAGPVFFAGVSMGGMTAQALAVRHPQLLRGIVIANSSAYYADKAPWQAREARVKASGVVDIADGAVERWLTPAFRATPEGAAQAAALRATLVATDAAGYIASCNAVAAIDFRDSNRRISVPTLVLAGSQDLATPPAMSEEIASAIPGAQLQSIDAAHISPAERPADFARITTLFVEAHA